MTIDWGELRSAASSRYWGLALALAEASPEAQHWLRSVASHSPRSQVELAAAVIDRGLVRLWQELPEQARSPRVRRYGYRLGHLWLKPRGEDSGEILWTVILHRIAQEGLPLGGYVILTSSTASGIGVLLGETVRRLAGSADDTPLATPPAQYEREGYARCLARQIPRLIEHRQLSPGAPTPLARVALLPTLIASQGRKHSHVTEVIAAPEDDYTKIYWDTIAEEAIVRHAEGLILPILTHLEALGT